MMGWFRKKKPEALTNRSESARFSNGDIVTSNGRVINHASDGDRKAKKNEDKDKESKKKDVMQAARLLQKESHVIKGILRDFQTYVPPIAYEAKTDDPEKNERINTYVKTWASGCDLYKQDDLWGMVGLWEVGKTRDGFSALALVDNFKLQHIKREQVGNPAITEWTNDAYYPPNFPREKRSPEWYRDGYELDVNGAPIRVHLWKKEYITAKEAALDPLAMVTNKNGERWVYDTSFDYKSFFPLTDPLDTQDFFGVSDFAPAIEKVESAMRMMLGVVSQAEFFSRFAGILHGGDGSLDDLPGADNATNASSCEKCNGEGCSECVSQFMMGFLNIWALPEGKEFMQNVFKLDSESFSAMLDTCFASPAISCHLPPSFIGIAHAGKAQGTMERISLEKAQAEFKRRRRKHKPALCRIMEAVLLNAINTGELEGVEEDDILEGEFIYPIEVSADIPKMLDGMRKDRDAGLMTDSEVWNKTERSPVRMRKAKKREALAMIQDIKDIMGDQSWKPSPDFVAALLRNNSNGGQQPISEAEVDDPPEISEAQE